MCAELSVTSYRAFTSDYQPTCGTDVTCLPNKDLPNTLATRHGMQWIYPPGGLDLKEVLPVIPVLSTGTSIISVCGTVEIIFAIGKAHTDACVSFMPIRLTFPCLFNVVRGEKEFGFPSKS